MDRRANRMPVNYQQDSLLHTNHRVITIRAVSHVSLFLGSSGIPTPGASSCWSTAQHPTQHPPSPGWRSKFRSARGCSYPKPHVHIRTYVRARASRDHPRNLRPFSLILFPTPPPPKKTVTNLLRQRLSALVIQEASEGWVEKVVYRGASVPRGWDAHAGPFNRRVIRVKWPWFSAEMFRVVVRARFPLIDQVVGEKEGRDLDSGEVWRHGFAAYRRFGVVRDDIGLTKSRLCAAGKSDAELRALRVSGAYLTVHIIFYFNLIRSE